MPYRCPKCGGKLKTNIVAIKSSACPKCGTEEVKLAMMIKDPASLLGLGALIAAGISMLLREILEGEDHNKRKKRIARKHKKL